MWCDKNMPVLEFLYSYDKWVISFVDECATEIPKLPSIAIVADDVTLLFFRLFFFNIQKRDKCKSTNKDSKRK